MGRAEIRLALPTVTSRESYLRGIRAFQLEGLPWHLGVDLDCVARDFPTFVAQKLADALPRDAGIPRTHLWALLDGEFAGSVSIRQRGELKRYYWIAL